MLQMKSVKVSSCNTMLVRLLDILLNLKTSPDSKYFYLYALQGVFEGIY